MSKQIVLHRKDGSTEVVDENPFAGTVVRRFYDKDGKLVSLAAKNCG